MAHFIVINADLSISQSYTYIYIRILCVDKYFMYCKLFTFINLRTHSSSHYHKILVIINDCYSTCVYARVYLSVYIINHIYIAYVGICS